MKMNRLLNIRDTIYGACAIWIMLYHIYRYLSSPNLPVITNFLEIGLLGVDIFLFLSGVCLSISAKRNKYSGRAWSAFFRKRAIRLLIPYVIVGIPFYCWMTVFTHSGGVFQKTLWFLADFTFISYLLTAKTALWFVFGITVYYLVFPFLFRFAKENTPAKNALLLLTMICFSTLCTFIPILRNIRIVFARLPIFAIGVYYGIKEDDWPEPGRVGTLLSVLVLAALGWVTSEVMLPAGNNTMNLFSWYLFIPMTLLLLMLVSITPKRISLMNWLGSFSLEIYLVHIAMIRPLSYFGVIDLLGNWLYLVLPLCAISVAYMVRLLSNFIQKRLMHFHS